MPVASDLEPQIRLAVPGDADEIARLWSVCTPDSVWSQLGTRVGTVYFRRFCTGGHEVGMTAWTGDQLAGACLGTDRPQSYARAFYAEHLWELARAFARELPSRPAIARVVLARVTSGLVSQLHSGETCERRRPTDVLPDLGLDACRSCYLSEIFVHPSARGQQLGSALIRRFCDEMAVRGCEACFVHVLGDNVASQIAQRRAGFECVARHGVDLTFVRKLTE